MVYHIFKNLNGVHENAAWIEVVTKFPCLLGHPVHSTLLTTVYTTQGQKNIKSLVTFTISTDNFK